MSLVVSVHVYSVQKALLKDSAPLYSVDYDAIKENMQHGNRCQKDIPAFVLALRPWFDTFVTSCLQIWGHRLLQRGSHVLSGAAAGQRGPPGSST